MSLAYRKKLINKKDIIPVNKQCELLGLSRSNIYYKHKPRFSDEDTVIMFEIKKIYSKYPFYGHRRIHDELLSRNYNIGRDRVLYYMKLLNLGPVRK